VVLDLTGVASYCDGFVICSGTNRRHVRAIAEGIVEDLRKEGLRPIGIEGLDASRWVLLDFGDVLVHVFDEPMRGFYDLEALWADAPRVDLDFTPRALAEGVASTR
jgi:ribosome-associated protein